MRSYFFESSVYKPNQRIPDMDTLHFEPPSFHSPDGSHAPDDRARRSDEMNLSDVDVFMLRGRRLQAQVIGDALRRAFAKLPHLLRRRNKGSRTARQHGCHRHA
jgi:hypothetical protein